MIAAGFRELTDFIIAGIPRFNVRIALIYEPRDSMINEPFAMGTSAEVDFFPEAPRVIYDKAPLSRVICQLRFPSVLKIESSIPADFQERIRGRFPVFEKSNQILPTLPAGLPPNFAELLAGQAVGASNRFATEDGKSTIELSSSSIGFSRG